MTRIAVLMTCFNRREQTLQCLHYLYAQVLPEDTQFSVYLTDDGSTDGTSNAVKEAFPDVHLLKGDGNLYWSGGMRLAWQSALKESHDFYLWLNDDTLLSPEAFSILLDCQKELENDAIVVGSTYDAQTKAHSYGGLIRTSAWRPLRFKRIGPKEKAVKVDTMNGNCVLISQQVVDKIGILSESFTHGIGDFDYGLRAGQKGSSVWISPGFVGTCSRNDSEGTWLDDSLSIRERLQKVNTPKGLPFREWFVFSKRHGGPFWPFYWLSPYVRILLRL